MHFIFNYVTHYLIEFCLWYIPQKLIYQWKTNWRSDEFQYFKKCSCLLDARIDAIPDRFSLPRELKSFLRNCEVQKPFNVFSQFGRQCLKQKAKLSLNCFEIKIYRSHKTGQLMSCIIIGQVCCVCTRHAGWGWFYAELYGHIWWVHCILVVKNTR